MKKIQSIGLHLGTAGTVTQSRSISSLPTAFVVKTLQRYEPFKEGPIHMIRGMVEDHGVVQIPSYTFFVAENGKEHWRDCVHAIAERFSSSEHTIEQEIIWEKKKRHAILHVYAIEAMPSEILHDVRATVLEKIESVYERITIEFK